MAFKGESNLLAIWGPQLNTCNNLPGVLGRKFSGMGNGTFEDLTPLSARQYGGRSEMVR